MIAALLPLAVFLSAAACLSVELAIVRLGESLAMVFFPVVMLGLYEVLRRDERKWPLLALGMTGVCMSHLLSTMFCMLFCAIAALASAGRRSQ